MTYPERVKKYSFIALITLAVLTLAGALMAGAGLPTAYLAAFAGIGVAICGIIQVVAKNKVKQQA